MAARVGVRDRLLLIRTEIVGVLRRDIRGGFFGFDAIQRRLNRRFFRVSPGFSWRLQGLLFLLQARGAIVFLALHAEQAEFVTLACDVGLLAFAFLIPDLGLGEAVILHQWQMTGADVRATTAFDAIEQAVIL